MRAPYGLSAEAFAVQHLPPLLSSVRSSPRDPGGQRQAAVSMSGIPCREYATEVTTVKRPARRYHVRQARAGWRKAAALS